MSHALIDALKNRRSSIAVLGLGYTGWPLALALSEHFEVRGFDTDAKRIAQLQQRSSNTAIGANDGPSAASSSSSSSMLLSSDPAILSGCDCYIIAVPTPVTQNNEPDLRSLEAALLTVSAVLKSGGLVILESTVYPGCTEEFCKPILEEHSGLKAGMDFGLGYSPERINPGDQVHTLATVTKLVSALHTPWLEPVKFIYETIVTAGVYVCSTVKVAEAAKMTENIQRDVNIALVNQLAELYEQLSIDAGEVWQAAATKWNFLPFRPGLAGGHCISVDPYYLLHRSSLVPFAPTLVAEARRVNELVKSRIIKRILAHLQYNAIEYPRARLLIKGVTFKANVADVRNSKIVAVALELMALGCKVELSDPLADAIALQHEYGLSLVSKEGSEYDVIVVAADHADYYLLQENYFCERTRQGALIVDLAGIYRNRISQRNYWTL